GPSLLSSGLPLLVVARALPPTMHLCLALHRASEMRIQTVTHRRIRRNPSCVRRIRWTGGCFPWRKSSRTPPAAHVDASSDFAASPPRPEYKGRPSTAGVEPACPCLSGGTDGRFACLPESSRGSACRRG